jgi:hypothetical protein
MRTALFLACLFLLLPAQLPAQFQPHVDYAVGSAPFSVAVGDFKGDGKLDLAVTNSASNTVSVLLGNGDGTFQAHVDYPTGNRPTSVVVADFRGVGKRDLAITNGNDNTVGVLLGNGDGTFQPHVDYATGDINPQWLVVADFNRDGKLDIATANYGPNYTNATVSIFLGNGDGTFQPAKDYAAGVNPFGVMTGDFNHDGIPDLAVVDNNGSFGVQILLGNGDGSFQAPVYYATGDNPRVGVVADFNGDGNLDLAIGNCIDNDVSILMGDGQGHFAAPVNYAAGDIVQTVAGGDFNGDGKLDLAVANQQSNNVSVLLGNGDGTFQAQVQYATGSGPLWVAVGDFNGDGAPDLVTANINANSVSVLLQANVRATTTTLVSSRNPAVPNQRVTYTATVTSQYGRGNTGTVTFRDGGQTIATVTLANHQAAFSTRYGTTGTHAITAIYSGDADSNGSTSPTLMEYITDTSKTVATTSGSPSFVGQPVTFTAIVGSLYGAIPDGELVTFYDGSTALGSVALAGGTAAYTTSSLSVETHLIKVTYPGDASFRPSNGSVVQVVSKYPTRTTLTSRPNPSKHDQAVTFTAKVRSAGPDTPTGKVLFMDGIFGIGTTTLSGGVATLTSAKLAVGTHPITAQYLGDGVSAKSTSSVLNQVVQ